MVSVKTQKVDLPDYSNIGYHYLQRWPALGNAASAFNLTRSAVDFYCLYAVAFDAYAPQASTMKLWPHIDYQFMTEVLEYTPEQVAEIVDARNAEWTERERLQYASRGRFAALIDTVVPAIREYCIMAVCGEARHHPAIGGPVLNTDRRRAWCGAKDLYTNHGPEVLKLLAELHEEIQGANVAGTPWANAARVTYALETNGFHPDPMINKMIFLDRVWNMQHNCGVLFNKHNFALQIEDPNTASIYNLNETLEWHGKNPPKVKMMANCASPDVREMFKGYVELVNSARTTELDCTNKFCRDCLLPDGDGHALNCPMKGKWIDHIKEWRRKKVKDPGFIRVDEEGTVHLDGNDNYSMRVYIGRGPYKSDRRLVFYEWLSGEAIADQIVDLKTNWMVANYLERIEQGEEIDMGEIFHLHIEIGGREFKDDYPVSTHEWNFANWINKVHNGYSIDY